MDITINSIGLIVILICSLVYSFFGYRFFKSLLCFAGAIIFSSIAWKFSSGYFQENFIPAIIIALIAAAIGAWLFYALFKVAAFLYGASVGLALSPVILTFIENPPTWVPWVLPVGCALGGGLILLLSHRLVLITMTAASGSFYFSMSLLLLLVQWKVLQDDILEKPDNLQAGLWLLCFATCFVSGWIYQLSDKAAKESS